MGVRLLGRAMLGPLVVAAINYDFVRTDLTGNLSKIFMLRTSEIIWIWDLGPEHKYASIAYRSNPFSQSFKKICSSTLYVA